MRELICPSALQQAFVVITRRTVELFVDASKVDHIADGGRQTRCLLFSSYGGGVVVVAINRSLACSALTLVAALEGITIRMYSSIYRFGWLIWGGGLNVMPSLRSFLSLRWCHHCRFTLPPFLGCVRAQSGARVGRVWRADLALSCQCQPRHAQRDRGRQRRLGGAVPGPPSRALWCCRNGCVS